MKQTSLSSMTNDLTKTYKYMILYRNHILSRTKHSSMFNNFNIKNVLTNGWKMFCFKTSKTDLDPAHMNLKNQLIE